jgi:hypothetical protein
MSEFTRVSLRQARESTAAALKAVDEILDRLSGHGASSVTVTLANSRSKLQEVAYELQLVDEHIQKKAGLLPATTSGESPAK